MKQFLFRHTALKALVVAGALAAAPVTSASAAGLFGSTTLFATLQGTGLLGQEIPILGTQGYYITVPVGSQVAPQLVWNAIDFTVASEVQIGNEEIVNLYVDPHMAK
jgi:hypothetical protein